MLKKVGEELLIDRAFLVLDRTSHLGTVTQTGKKKLTDGTQRTSARLAKHNHNIINNNNNKCQAPTPLARLHKATETIR